jgi:trk system potassium uptake protein TrkH
VAATAVWDTGVLGAGAVALPIAVAFALIGGSPVSTAGGVKFLRFFLLSRQALVELQRLAHPSSVAEVRYRGRTLPRSALIGLLVYVLGYAGVIAGLMLALGAVGASFRAAAAGAVAAVSNAGPLITLLGDETATHLRSEPVALTALGAGMVLGRVEVLAAFAMLTPAFWRR